MLIKERQDMLEYMYDSFNKQFFNNELPTIAITIQSCGRKKDVMGWCTVLPVWISDEEGSESYYEINLCPEHFTNDIYVMSDTLIHEMVHLSNAINSIKDCNKKGVHNKKFRAGCEFIGLNVEEDERYGFANTSLSDSMKEYVETLKIDANIFNYYRLPEPEKVKKPNVSAKYECPCCGVKLTSKAKGLKIKCVECETDFEEQEEE